MKQGTPYTPFERSMRTRTGTAWLALRAGELIDEINDPKAVYPWHLRGGDTGVALAETCLRYGIKPYMQEIEMGTVGQFNCDDVMWQWQGDMLWPDSLTEGWDQI